MRALQALKRSPLALDLYAWSTYTAFSVNKSGKERSVSWDLLHQQFGADYDRVRDFKAKALAAFKKIKVVYPDLQTESVKGGIKVLPSIPAVLPKSQKDAVRVASSSRSKPQLLPETLLQELSETETISASTYEKAKQLALGAGTDWDIRELERQFHAYATKKGRPSSPDKAFLGFVKRKIQKRP